MIGDAPESRHEKIFNIRDLIYPNLTECDWRFFFPSDQASDDETEFYVTPFRMAVLPWRV
jgi:hypothetical protein